MGWELPWGTWDVAEISFFCSACFPAAYFCRFLLTFADFWVNMSPKWTTVFSQTVSKEHHFSTRCTQVAPVGSRRGLGCPSDPPLHPNGAKRVPKIEVSGGRRCRACASTNVPKRRSGSLQSVVLWIRFCAWVVGNMG